MNKKWKSVFNNSIGTPKDMTIEARRITKNAKTLSLHDMKEHNDRAYAEMLLEENTLIARKRKRSKYKWK